MKQKLIAFETRRASTISDKKAIFVPVESPSFTITIEPPKEEKKPLAPSVPIAVKPRRVRASSSASGLFSIGSMHRESGNLLATPAEFDISDTPPISRAPVIDFSGGLRRRVRIASDGSEISVSLRISRSAPS